MHATVEKYGVDGAVQKFLDDKVEQKKIDLALSVMERENKIIALSRDNSFSLYVSIPFLPEQVLILFVCVTQHSKCKRFDSAVC